MQVPHTGSFARAKISDVIAMDMISFYTTKNQINHKYTHFKIRWLGEISEVHSLKQFSHDLTSVWLVIKLEWLKNIDQCIFLIHNIYLLAVAKLVLNFIIFNDFISS